jgi:hypothetical protein
MGNPHPVVAEMRRRGETWKSLAAGLEALTGRAYSWRALQQALLGHCTAWAPLRRAICAYFAMPEAQLFHGDETASTP